MASLEKLSFYLDSFSTNDPNYDYACYIREKLAEAEATYGDNLHPGLHEEENNNSLEMETSEFDKTKENLEGKLMSGAFKDLDVLNELDKEKQINLSEEEKDKIGG